MMSQNLKLALFTAFTNYLKDKAVSHVIVGDVSGYPKAIGSDVDIVVSQDDFERLDKLLLEFARAKGVDLVQVLRHEVSSAYYVISQRALSERTQGERAYLALDMGSDYMRDGQTFIAAERFLAQRREHASGFFVPEPRVGFIYYLLKKVLKGGVDERQWAYIKETYAEDEAGGAEELRGLWSEVLSQKVVSSLASDNLASFQALMGDLEKQLPKKRALLPELKRVVKRVTEPTGLWIAMFGPDGAGKSTIIEALETNLSPAFRHVLRRHLRPHLGKKPKASDNAPVTDPHGEKARGSQTSLLKIAYWWADYTFGYWFQTLPASVRSTLTIFDRYYHDILVDPTRYRYGGPKSLTGFVGAIVPKPALTFILDAEPEVFQARKQEVTFEETARQRTAYQGLSRRLPGAHIIDVDREVSAIAAEVEDIIIAHMVERTRQRLS